MEFRRVLFRSLLSFAPLRPRRTVGARCRRSGARWCAMADRRRDRRRARGAIMARPPRRARVRSDRIRRDARLRVGPCPATRPRRKPLGSGAISPMTISPVEFASLLCSRLCHDLLSPVGALNNGLELLADEHDPEMRARCLELLGESARASASKLKFFRLAFGAAGGFGETVDTREARTAIEGLFGDAKRLEIGWLVDERSEEHTSERQALLRSSCAVLCL